QRQLHVPQTGGAREKIEGLENKSDLAVPDRSQLVIIHRGNILAVEFVTARARRIKTAEHIHESRFTTAARPHDGEVFVAMDLEGHAAQRVHGLFAHHVMLRDVLDIDDDRTARSNRIRGEHIPWPPASRGYFGVVVSLSMATFAPSFSLRLIAL